MKSSLVRDAEFKRHLFELSLELHPGRPYLLYNYANGSAVLTTMTGFVDADGDRLAEFSVSGILFQVPLSEIGGMLLLREIVPAW